YIDWNRDGDFVDANEQAAVEAAAVTGAHTWTGSITAPANVTAGFTRMRVINNEATTITPPTGTFSWGEVEDYTIQLASNAGFTFSWSDGTNVIATANGAYTPATAGSYSYTVIGTDANGCSITGAPVAVTVNPVPATPTGTNSNHCGLAVPTCSVTGTGSPANKFRWYLAPTGGTSLAGENGSTLVNYAISTTTSFYVSEYDTITGCESGRVQVDVTVATPILVTATSSPSTICPGGTVNLEATTPTVNNYTFTWYKKLGTGAYQLQLQAASFSDVLNLPGTYTYSVQAYDPVLLCATNATTTVTVTTPPSISVVNANPASACAGSTVTLTGTTTMITSGPQTGPTGYPASNATSTLDEEILNVTFKTINQSSLCTTLAPGTGSIAQQYSNYTGVPAPTVTVGEVVSFSVQIGTCNGNYTNRSVIYIDWNRDGDFLDASETAATEPAGVSGAHTWTGTITVPSSSVAVAGVTRMRVINNETTAVTASNVTYTWGETEDYHINVLA
ncbi:MAG: GEVED domain-containing protein, partial [Bacteroidota bacterium]